MHSETSLEGESVPPPSGVAEEVGSLLGPYRLLETIGEGGFGTVFRAEQSHPVRRHVALKILKLGMDTRQVVARFEAERQALALMDHPAIAKVYDAGATETGRPYFVMELVEGEPLTGYCDRRGLTTHERLELFGDVCLAVQHAHQKGVLHRDLKPSNVLVTEVDGVPLPKVIDFGIAKAIEGPLTDLTLATEAFQVVGTPEYMSPEQAGGRDVDTRADVYALGVLLYEMLTRTQPFGRAASESGGTGGLDQLGELLRQIHEVTPPKPSTRVSQLRKSSSSGDTSDTRVLTRALRGDLDWIVMKALEKDRERRYASAAELADDVARHLASEPVLASPPSTTYRMRKFVRRNRLAVGSAVALSGTLVAATIGLGVLYARSLASEESAKREAETSRQALGFMTGMFEVSDPSQARGETVTAREILDRGAERIERELGDQPAIRSTLMETMGQVYRGLGLYDRAEELMGSAARIRRDLSGEEHPETLRLSAGIAGLWTRQSRFEESEELLRETIERQERVLGPDHADLLGSRLSLSEVLDLRSEYDEAEALALETLEAARRTLGEDHELTLLALTQLGIIYEKAARFDEAEEQFLKGLEVCRRTLGGDHPETLLMIVRLGELCMNMGRFEEAEGLFGEAQETARRVFGDEHPDFVMYRSKLGLLYREQVRLEEAEEVYREIIEIQRRTLGDDHLNTLLSLNTLGVVLSNQRRYDEAEPYYLEALEGMLREVGEQSDHTLTVSGNMAIFYLDMGQLEEAQTWARKTYEGAKALHGEDHPTTIRSLENLANVSYKQRDEAGAAEILERVLEARRRALGNEHPAITRTLVNLSVVRGSLGDREGATAVREELLERALAGLGFDYVDVADEIDKLARDLVRAEEYERAADCLGEVLRIRRETLGADDPWTLAAMRDCLQVAILLERWPEMEALGPECYEAHVRVLGAADSKTQLCLRRIAEGYEKRGDELLAETWRAKLQNAGD